MTLSKTRFPTPYSLACFSDIVHTESTETTLKKAIVKICLVWMAWCWEVREISAGSEWAINEEDVCWWQHASHHRFISGSQISHRPLRAAIFFVSRLRPPRRKQVLLPGCPAAGRVTSKIPPNCLHWQINLTGRAAQVGDPPSTTDLNSRLS